MKRRLRDPELKEADFTHFISKIKHTYFYETPPRNINLSQEWWDGGAQFSDLDINTPFDAEKFEEFENPPPFH